MIKPVVKSDVLVFNRTPAAAQSGSAPRVDAFTRRDTQHVFKKAGLTDYVWHPSWALRTAVPPATPHNHDDSGGGNVPIDLDEAAAAVTVAANRLGLGWWFKMPFLATGIKYAYDGAHEALETIVHWHGGRRACDASIQATQEANRSTRADNDIYRRSRQKNAQALVAMQRTAKSDGDRKLALALPTLAGCVGMGGSLLCMADVLGGIFPALEALADPLMHVAVPAMCVFAIGMFAFSLYDEAKNLAEGWSLAKIAKAAKTAGTAPQGGEKVGPVPDDQNQNAGSYAAQNMAEDIGRITRQRRLRTASNAANATLAVSMGVGVWMLGAGSLAGLWFMLPGALGLALAQYLRAAYVGHGRPFGVEDVVDLGGKRQISCEIAHTKAQMQILREAQKAHRSDNPSSRMKRLLTRQTQAQRDAIAQNMRMVAAKAARKVGVSPDGLSALQSQDERLAAMQQWLQDGDTTFSSRTEAAQSVIHMLHSHGLLDTLALKLGQDRRFDAALARSQAPRGRIGFTNESIVAAASQSAETFEAFCDTALGVVTTDGVALLGAQKRALLRFLSLRLRQA